MQRGTITVKGKGKYSGIICESFKIVPKGTTLGKVSKKNTVASVKWKKQSAKKSSERITGYLIRYSTNSSMKNAKKVTARGYENISATIKKLKKNKKYYFQVRTYVKTKKDICFPGGVRKRESDFRMQARYRIRLL